MEAEGRDATLVASPPAAGEDEPRVDCEGGRLKTYVSLFKGLMPLIFGLVFARAGLIVSTYGSYTATDDGLFTDGAMIVVCFVMGILVLALVLRGEAIPKRTVNRIMRVSTALEVVTVALLAAVAYVPGDQTEVRFALSTLCALTASFSMFYWLRRARGANTVVAATCVFSALAISEVELYVCSFMPVYVADAVAAALALLQFPCMAWCRRVPLPYELEGPTLQGDFFGFCKTELSRNSFLIASAIAIGLFSIVIGSLRGFAQGNPVAFTFVTRTAYAAATIAFCAVIISGELAFRERTLTVHISIIMQSLTILAIITYAAFPDHLDIGGAFTTTCNALMVGFTWYVVVAFMSYGWRDPYYYALGGWIAWLGARSVARMAIMFAAPLILDTGLLLAILSGVLLIAAQLIFVMMLNASRAMREDLLQGAGERSPERDHESTSMARIMGLDQDAARSDARSDIMRRSAEKMGKQFLLSEREVDVLALYALGYTQKRVGELLFISQGTAHAHIKRIYSKTNLHSRQELIDYLEMYADAPHE